MKQPLLVLLLLFAAFTSNAKKENLPIEIVASFADLIVTGEINSVHGLTYSFKVSETLKGKVRGTITVRKFREWMCDTRRLPHKKGQKLCLFLKKGIAGWNIINGSTGEMIISNDSLNMHAEEYDAEGYDFSAYSLPLEEFKNGIRTFCKLYAFIGKYEIYGEYRAFKMLCSDAEIDEFKNMSRFSAWLNAKARKYEII
jgi:hypothetical protein